MTGEKLILTFVSFICSLLFMIAFVPLLDIACGKLCVSTLMPAAILWFYVGVNVFLIWVVRWPTKIKLKRTMYRIFAALFFLVGVARIIIFPQDTAEGTTNILLGVIVYAAVSNLKDGD